jgi:LysM repeat protein
MDGVENSLRFLRRIAVLCALPALVACAGDPLSSDGRIVPTARPDIRITPAPTQNVRGTATAFAQQIIPTATPQGLYIVKPGDTLSRIADEHQTTVDEIMAANNLSDPNLIEVGQRLTIPSGQVATDATTEPPATTEQPAETAPVATPAP